MQRSWPCAFLSRSAPWASAMVEVLAEIRRVLREELAVGREAQPTDDLVADLQLASGGLLTLAVGLEHRFPVPLYPRVRLGRLDGFHARPARMLASAGARVVVSDARISRLLGLSLEEARPELGLHTSLSGGEPRFAPGSPEDLALIQFSSGTTVDPKPVALTHRNLLTNVAAIDTFLPRTGSEAGVSWLPLYHDMGLIGCLLLAVVHPGPLTLLGPAGVLPRPALWLRAISRKRATLSVAPNSAYALCARRTRGRE